MFAGDWPDTFSNSFEVSLPFYKTKEGTFGDLVLGEDGLGLVSFSLIRLLYESSN